MTAKELKKRFKLDSDRIERKKKKCPLGSAGYLNLCCQQNEILLRYLREGLLSQVFGL